MKYNPSWSVVREESEWYAWKGKMIDYFVVFITAGSLGIWIIFKLFGV